MQVSRRNRQWAKETPQRNDLSEPRLPRVSSHVWKSTKLLNPGCLGLVNSGLLMFRPTWSLSKALLCTLAPLTCSETSKTLHPGLGPQKAHHVNTTLNSYAVLCFQPTLEACLSFPWVHTHFSCPQVLAAR